MAAAALAARVVEVIADLGASAALSLSVWVRVHRAWRDGAHSGACGRGRGVSGGARPGPGASPRRRWIRGLWAMWTARARTWPCWRSPTRSLAVTAADRAGGGRPGQCGRGAGGALPCGRVSVVRRDSVATSREGHCRCDRGYPGAVETEDGPAQRAGNGLAAGTAAGRDHAGRVGMVGDVRRAGGRGRVPAGGGDRARAAGGPVGDHGGAADRAGGRPGAWRWGPGVADPGGVVVPAGCRAVSALAAAAGSAAAPASRRTGRRCGSSAGPFTSGCRSCWAGSTSWPRSRPSRPELRVPVAGGRGVGRQDRAVV